MKKTVPVLVGISIAALAALAGLLFVMQRPPAPVATRAEPAPASSDNIAATIDDVVISYSAWQTATRLDAAMNRLAGQPVPSAEETLDRLINETLLLRAADLDTADVPPSEARARLDSLQAAWGLTDPQVETALADANLTRRDLEARVARLILVEKAIQTLSAQHSDLEAWLAQARQNIHVSLLEPLAAAPQPAAPTPTPPPLPPTDTPPAPDFTLPVLSGGTVRLSDLRGRPVLLNFWATWCPACRTELPALQAAYERYGDQVAFLAIDVKEPDDTVAKFITKFDLTFPVLLDRDGAVSDQLYRVRGIPTTLILAPDGSVSARHIGPLTEADIDRYLIPDPQSATPAPAFSLPAADGSTLALDDYRGRAVVLVFYRGYT